MDALRQLEERNAVLIGGHFVYTSGRHGSAYINLDLILPDVTHAARLCSELAAPFRGQVDVVAAPATGAIVLAVLTALAMSDNGKDVAAVWADKRAGEFVVERVGFAERLRGRDVLVVDDLITTGGSLMKVCREVMLLGGNVIGVSAVCNRGRITAADVGVPRLESLAQVDFESFESTNCPLCVAGSPLVENIGHGQRFKEEHPDYSGGYVRLE